MEMLLSSPEVVPKRLYVKRGIDWSKTESYRVYRLSKMHESPDYYCSCCDKHVTYSAQYRHNASAKHLKNLEKLNNDLSN